MFFAIMPWCKMPRLIFLAVDCPSSQSGSVKARASDQRAYIPE